MEINNSELSRVSSLADLRARQDLLRLKLEKQEEEISFRFYFFRKNISSILLNQFFPKNGDLNEKIISLVSLGTGFIFNKISGGQSDSGESLVSRIFNWISDKLSSWFGKSAN